MPGVDATGISMGVSGLWRRAAGVVAWCGNIDGEMSWQAWSYNCGRGRLAYDGSGGYVFFCFVGGRAGGVGTAS